MADTVQFYLERMLPDLDDLEKRGLFREKEIREIVNKRRDFEYLLKRPSPLKVDFLKYVEFEKNLEALRKLRKQTLIRDSKGKLWKPSRSDHSCVARILLIYKRALVRFKGDLQMWLQYLQFCKSEAPRKFQKVMANCLQLHPNNPGVWMYAAAWEFEENGNVKAARVLMQRGLRMCPNSEKLWIEYFRMELTYIQKLKGRKEVLGLHGTKTRRRNVTEDGSDLVLIDASDDEVKSDVENDEPDGVPCLEDQLSLKLSETIYRNAVSAVPYSLELRQRFLEVLDSFGFAQKKELDANIFASIIQDFSRDEKSWEWLARRHCPLPDKNFIHSSRFSEGKIKAIEIYEAALKMVPSSRMYELYIHFLFEILDLDVEPLAPASNNDLSANISSLQSEIVTSIVGLCDRALAAGSVSEKLVKDYMEVFRRSASDNEALALCRNLCERADTKVFACVWEWRISLEMNQTLLSHSTDGITSHFQQAFRCVPLADAKQLYLLAMEVYTGRDQYEVLLSPLEMAMAGGSGGGHGAELACAAVDWVLYSRGLKEARRVYKRFLVLPGVSVLFFKHCIRLETLSLASGGTGALLILRKLFDEAVGVYGQVDTELWTMYHHEERKAGNVDAAKNVYWRAKKALRDPTHFIETLQTV